MSAYICDDSVFATLAAFSALTIEGASAQAIADKLKAENVRSVNARYNESVAVQPVDMSETAAKTDRAGLLALVAEYDYQACECCDYNESEAARLVQVIRSNAVAYVPCDISSHEPAGLIGRAVYQSRGGRRGYVVSEGAAEHKTYTLGARGIEGNSSTELSIVWMPSNDAGVSLGLVLTHEPLNRMQAALESEYNWPRITPAQAAALVRDYEGERAAAIEKARLEREAKDTAATTFSAELAPLMPAACKGVIVAQLQQSECDTMTDYFASSTARTLILGFSLHNRDIFSEMRKALTAADLADLPELAQLADPENSEENREKYSGGRGYYLAAVGASSYSGWQVRKVSAWGSEILTADRVPVGELRLPKLAPPTPSPALTDGVTVTLNAEKQGIEIAFPAKPSSTARESLKALGFRWSRAAGLWYAKQSAERLAFANSLRTGCHA